LDADSIQGKTKPTTRNKATHYSELRTQPQNRSTSKKDEAQLRKNDSTTTKISRLVAICFEGVRVVPKPTVASFPQPSWEDGKSFSQLIKNDPTTTKIPRLVAICFEGVRVLPKPRVASFPQPSREDGQSLSQAEQIFSSLPFNNILPSKITMMRLVP
jgi:hypothetical protein